MSLNMGSVLEGDVNLVRGFPFFRSVEGGQHSSNAWVTVQL